MTYIYQTQGWYHIGVGIWTALPVVQGGEGEDIPLSFMLTLPMGWTSSVD